MKWSFEHSNGFNDETAPSAEFGVLFELFVTLF